VQRIKSGRRSLPLAAPHKKKEKPNKHNRGRPGQTKGTKVNLIERTDGSWWIGRIRVGRDQKERKGGYSGEGNLKYGGEYRLGARGKCEWEERDSKRTRGRKVKDLDSVRRK